MSISLSDFEPGYRSLSAAFGVNFNEQRMLIYHSMLSGQIKDVDEWRKLTSKLLLSNDYMPKISDITEIIGRTDARSVTYREVLAEWIDSDCHIIDCIDGNIHSEVNGYDTVYNCPRCKRTSVPSVKVWGDTVKERSDEDMKERKKDRIQLSKSIDIRLEKAKELMGMLASICKPTEKTKAESQPIKDLPPGTMSSDELIAAARAFRVQPF